MIIKGGSEGVEVWRREEFTGVVVGRVVVGARVEPVAAGELAAVRAGTGVTGACRVYGCGGGCGGRGVRLGGAVCDDAVCVCVCVRVRVRVRVRLYVCVCVALPPRTL